MNWKRKTQARLLVMLTMIIAMLLAGCLKGDNPTGNNWSDVRPLAFGDSTSFIAGYSFAGPLEVTGSETNLLTGNWDGLEAVALMRFTGMPSEGSFNIPAGYQDSTYLELTLTKRSPFYRYPVEMRVYKLNQSWAADSTSMVQDANMSPVSLTAFTIPDTISSTGTIVKIPIPAAEIENWYSEADTLGFSLVVKTGNSSYAEILSAETGRGPRLRFLYRNDTDTVDDDDSEYEVRATRDSYRVESDGAPLLANRWVVSNISPSRIYVNFALNNSLFKDMNGVALSDIQRKRATINKAELVLHVKSNPYYGSTTQYSLRGDRVKDSLDVSVPVEIGNDQVASGLISQAVVRGDSVVVNITPLIQAYSSGDSENWGIVIRSMQEALNFGKLEFWHFTDAPAGKKPKLKVTYTPPYL